MTKLSKHIQNKRKIREKKRAKKLNNVKTSGINKRGGQVIGASTKTITGDLEIPKNVQISSGLPSIRKLKKELHDPKRSGNNYPTTSSVDLPTHNKKEDVPALTTNKVKKQSLNPSSSLHSLSTSSSVTNEVNNSSDLKVAKKNKRWKKLKAELQEKKRRRKIEGGDDHQNEDSFTDQSHPHLSSSTEAEGSSDFKSLLLSSNTNAVSHRREKKREWRRHMKRLQKLKLKWVKEGRSDIEELVLKWRKQQREAATEPDEDHSESKAKKPTEGMGRDSNTINNKKNKNGSADQNGNLKLLNQHVNATNEEKAEEEDGDDDGNNILDPVNKTVQPIIPAASGATNKALQRLRVAQFRIINETLYTSKSDEAEELFKKDSSAFQIYHEGYRSQVCKWPINPLDRFIEEIKRGSPRGTCIADLGCGDAKLAKTLKPLGYKIHSFDLVAINEHVQACNMKDLPLNDESIDIVVMCLSLMGTDMGQFVLEANRILKTGGLLKIAEVESRIPDLEGFIKTLKRYGFNLNEQNTSHDIFVFFDFTKAKRLPKGAENNMSKPLWLKPCLYKKR